MRRAFPARVFGGRREWAPEQIREIVDNAIAEVEPKARFIRAAKPNPDQYIWVCLKNAVRDQIWELVPDELRQLHLALSSALRRSNGFRRERRLISLSEWPTDTPPCALEYQKLFQTWKQSIQLPQGSSRLGLKRGALAKAMRRMLELARGPVPRAWLYESLKQLLRLPQIVVGLPRHVENLQSGASFDTVFARSLTGARRPSTFEDLYALQLMIEEQQPFFVRTARSLYESLTPTQRFYAWAQYHDWPHTKIAEHLHVGLPRVSNLYHQYVQHLKQALVPAWTDLEIRAFLEVWQGLLHDEPRPTLPEARS